jgi:hypothetical protein
MLRSGVRQATLPLPRSERYWGVAKLNATAVVDRQKCAPRGPGTPFAPARSPERRAAEFGSSVLWQRPFGIRGAAVFADGVGVKAARSAGGPYRPRQGPELRDAPFGTPASNLAAPQIRAALGRAEVERRRRGPQMERAPRRPGTPFALARSPERRVAEFGSSGLVAATIRHSGRRRLRGRRRRQGGALGRRALPTRTRTRTARCSVRDSGKQPCRSPDPSGVGAWRS